jgi:hypothetical protein
MSNRAIIILDGQRSSESRANMPPYKRTLYRLQNDESHTIYSKDDGFMTSDIRTKINFKSRRELKNKRVLFRILDLYFDWGNKIDTPFISVYDNLNKAIEYAIIRLGDRKIKIRIAKIEINWRDNMTFTNVCKLIARTDYKIDYRISNYSRYKYLILY